MTFYTTPFSCSTAVFTLEVLLNENTKNSDGEVENIMIGDGEGGYLKAMSVVELE